MEDTEILELYWQRSSRASEETEQRYGPMCRRLAQNILSDPEDAEECVNDAYLALWQSIPPRRPERLGAFLASVTRNLCISRRRKRYRLRDGL